MRRAWEMLVCGFRTFDLCCAEIGKLFCFDRTYVQLFFFGFFFQGSADLFRGNHAFAH